MMGCKKCMTTGGILFLIVGLLFLLVDLGVWTFYGIQWWTALFLIFGLGHLGHSNCPQCRAVGVKRKK